MKKNLNSPEGIVRLVIAAACFYLLYFINSEWQLFVMMLCGLFFFTTGIWRICPFYTALKISTIRQQRNRKNYRS